ncbi:MAG: AAA family ATPase [Bacteroidetes bacterium]|nr:AAA family ATPase [Bacteroidota bacterium]
MIPLSLKLKGIYSYQEEQIIDFARLTEAGLFGIFGKVGSGKSAILDAISYAIYGDNDRFQGRNVDLKYNMMNLKSNEMIIDFTFLAGSQKRKFTIKIRALRNKKKFDEVTIKEHNYYELLNDGLVPILPEVIISEIGVSYENFNRTIVIPQGKFQDFLSLKPTDRTQMLQEIFNLGKYDLSSKVKILSDQNKDSLIKINARLEGVDDVSTENINLKKEEKSERSKKKDELALQIDPAKAELNLLNQLATDLKAYEEKNGELASLQGKEQEYVLKEKELSEFRSYKTEFKPLFDNLSADQKQLNTCNASIEQYSQKDGIITEQLHKAKIALDITQNDKAKIPTLTKKADQLNQLVLFYDLKKRHENLRSRLTIEESKIKADNKKVADSKKSRDAVAKEIVGLTKSASNLEYLKKIKNWYDKNRMLEEKEKEMLEGWTDVKNEKSEKNKELTILKKGAFKNIFKKLPADFDIDEFKEIWEEEKSAFENTQKALLDQKLKLSVQQKLVDHASNLTKGEPCPLCGSTHHPNPMKKIDIKRKLDEIENKIEGLDTELNMLDELWGDMKSILKDIKQLVKRCEDAEIKWNKSKESKNDHAKKFPKGIYKKEQVKEFEKEWKELESKQKKLQDSSKIREGLDREIEKMEDHLSNEKLTFENKKREEDQMAGQLEEKIKLFTVISIEDYKDRPATSIENEIRSIRSSIVNIETTEKERLQEIKDLDQEQSTISGSLIEKKREKERLEASISDTNIKIDTSTEKLARDRNEVLAILEKQLDEKRITDEVERFKANLNQLKGQVSELQGKTQGKKMDVERLNLLRSQIPLQLKELEELNGSIAVLENDINVLEAKLTEKQLFLKEKEKLTERELSLGELTTLFKSKGFVNFLSSKYLNNVVQIANQRFYKMTRQKYKLELTADNSFMIRDFMNNGELRHIKSLSGGQTFQAALSLALALSENIQRNAGVDQQFFFLDEGFGSLDKESLQVVFDTLKTLRNERRVVGLISHVEDLQQDIDVYLKIEEDPVSGSKIVNSWSSN